MEASVLTPKQWRVVSEKTQQDVADALGIHVNTWAEYERTPSKMSIYTCVKFCDFIGVNLNQVNFLP